MRELIRWSAILGVGVVAAISTGQTAAQKPATKPAPNAHALVLKDFQDRINNYLELHNDVEKGPAQLKETNEPEQIRQAQMRLAERIRAVRKDARPGDIFTPEIRATFRRLMYPELRGTEGRRTRAEINEDAPAGVPLKVNASYPEGASLPTVPPNLLASLPQLPEDLEYRIIRKDLILRDVNANLIVDFIPNAIQ